MSGPDLLALGRRTMMLDLLRAGIDARFDGGAWRVSRNRDGTYNGALYAWYRKHSAAPEPTEFSRLQEDEALAVVYGWTAVTASP